MQGKIIYYKGDPFVVTKECQDHIETLCRDGTKLILLKKEL